VDAGLRHQPTGFDELLESRLLGVLERIGTAPIAEIESELHSLSKLVNAYRLNDELLENLLNPTTTFSQCEEIRETLHLQHLRLAENRAELLRLHEKSHSILEHSAQLLAKIDRQVYQFEHKNSEYAPEICANCGGIGSVNCNKCLSCDGRRTLLVHQPPIKCPRCYGTGRSGARDRFDFSQHLCIICRGKGWVLVQDQ
jgi:hypothetical protein